MNKKEKILFAEYFGCHLDDYSYEIFKAFP